MCLLITDNQHVQIFPPKRFIAYNKFQNFLYFTFCMFMKDIFCSTVASVKLFYGYSMFIYLSGYRFDPSLQTADDTDNH